MTNKLSFLGLGVMGFPMAGHLSAAGHDVTVYNRTASRAEDWLKTHKGQRAATPAEAARDADVVFACVGEDADVREICLGEHGAFDAMKPGAVFVDHTTASASLARALAETATARGLGFVDAPVSGGQAGAEGGTLTVMCGGDANAFETVRPFIECYARMLRLLGPAGSGQSAKMVNQICIAGVLQGLSEALHFCTEAGLDPDAVVEVISQGAAQSWQMDNRAATMSKGEFDFGFAVDWMRKDLAIVLDEARQRNVSLPLTALVDQFYNDIQNMGGGRLDTSSLIRRFRG